jgi:hypothetical protein
MPLSTRGHSVKTAAPPARGKHLADRSGDAGPVAHESYKDAGRTGKQSRPVVDAAGAKPIRLLFPGERGFDDLDGGHESKIDALRLRHAHPPAARGTPSAIMAWP